MLRNFLLKQAQKCSILENLLTASLDQFSLFFDERRIFPESLADFQVLSLYDTLASCNFQIDQRISNRGILPQCSIFPGKKMSDAIPCDQIILEADKEPRGSRIALATSPSPKLMVNPEALMPVRADNI